MIWADRTVQIKALVGADLWASRGSPQVFLPQPLAEKASGEEVVTPGEEDCSWSRLLQVSLLEALEWTLHSGRLGPLPSSCPQKSCWEGKADSSFVVLSEWSLLSSFHGLLHWAQCLAQVGTQGRRAGLQ